MLANFPLQSHCLPGHSCNSCQRLNAKSRMRPSPARAPRRNLQKINLAQYFQSCTSQPITHTTPIPSVFRECRKQWLNNVSSLAMIHSRPTAHSSSLIELMCFFRNSKDEKNTAFTAQDRPMETPRPRYMCLRKNSIFTGGTVWPREYIRQLR